VDGNHRFDGIILDLVYLGRLLHPVVLVDDYQLPAVAYAASLCRPRTALRKSRGVCNEPERSAD
jgi:hypothetical protein